METTRLCTFKDTQSLWLTRRHLESHSSTSTTLQFSFNATPTLIVASCRFRNVFLVRTFPFLRHLLSDWWFYPKPNWYVLITWDAFNQRDTQHIKQRAEGEDRNASRSQSHSFRFVLHLSSWCGLCAKLPWSSQSRIWGIEACSRCLPNVWWSGSYFSWQMRNICRRRLVDHVRRGLFLLNPPQMEIKNYKNLLIRDSILKACVITLGVLKSPLYFQHCRMCFT